MGGSSGGDQTTSSEPWSGVRPFLREGFGEAQNLYESGGLAALGPQSQNTLLSQQMGADYALGGGSGLVPQAQGLAGATIGGDYLTGSTNPYFQDAISYSTQPIIDQWREQIAPNIDATFGGTAGGLSSGAYASARNRSEDTLARNLAGAATQAGAGNYATERGRQLQTMAQAPGLNMAGYGDIANLGRIGQQQDIRNQLEAGQQGAGLAEYMRLLQGGLNFGESQTQNNPGIMDYVSQGAGLGLTGLAVASDVRLKEDIRQVDTLSTGEGVYFYRYKGDDTVYRGVLAQEIAANYPEAVFKAENGFLAVNYNFLPDMGWKLPKRAL